MASKSNGDNMNVISETLKGNHSFTGIGILNFDGREIAICGSKQIFCGDGKRVKYVAEMLRRIEPEANRKDMVPVFLTTTATATAGDPVVLDPSNKPLLMFGLVDGVYLGGEYEGAAANVFSLHPGFVLHGIRPVTYETVELSSGLVTAFFPAEQNFGPFYYLSERRE